MKITKTPFSWSATIRAFGYDFMLAIIHLENMAATAEGGEVDRDGYSVDDKITLDVGRVPLTNIKADMDIVLDFVERWNKNDAEKEVAEAHHRLEDLLSLPPATQDDK